MAVHDSGSYHQNFVEEINYDDIQKLEVVGTGSFGTVYRGKWKDKFVAVKHIDSEAEKKTFSVEIRQLSRVNHPNIVKLYGACTKNPVCLVMEYAEGGSLYNVLHGRPAPKYNAGHAVSWTLQCAKGVAYLHNMRPKALIHRDLKPPNLLLEMGGRVLKICDFGTACDLKTYMTNNKGSAAWMAPEVFEGSNYTEKCDVFSWGIILWQVLTREKPFNEVGVNALRIMWSVHQGKRPPLIEGCPKPLENLMTRCWSKTTTDRPSMNEIVQIMSTIFPFFPGHDEPLIYSSEDSYDSEVDDMVTEDDSISDIPDSCTDSQQSVNGSISGTTAPTATPFSTPLSINLNAGGESWSNNFVELPSDALKLQNPMTTTESYNNVNGSTNLVTCNNVNGSTDSTCDKLGGAESDAPDEVDDKIYLMLDSQLRPLEPERTSENGVRIYEQHKNLAKEYLKVQTNLAYTQQRRQELADELSRCESLSLNTDEEKLERKKLESEKESLIIYCSSLKRKLEILEAEKSQKPEWGII